MQYETWREALIKDKLNDDDLYNALFTHRPEPPKWNEERDIDGQLDECLFFLFEHDTHEYIISILKQGGFLQSVFDGLMFNFGIEMGKQWYGLYNGSNRNRTMIIIELINRVYDKDINYRRHIKPLTHRKVIDYNKREKETIHKIRPRKPKRLAKKYCFKKNFLTYPPDIETSSN